MGSKVTELIELFAATLVAEVEYIVLTAVDVTQVQLLAGVYAAGGMYTVEEFVGTGEAELTNLLGATMVSEVG